MNDSRDVLKRACAIARIDATGVRLLRVGSDAVYRLKAPIIARVSRPGADAGHVRGTVAVARWLESAGYPAGRAVNVDQPVVIDQQIVTFWEAVSDDGTSTPARPKSPRSSSSCTSSPPPRTCTCPNSAPFASAPQRIEASTWLSPQDRAFLTSMLAQTQTAYAGLEFALPPGVIHGDANVGNVQVD